MEKQVGALTESDRIGRAVANAMQTQHGGILTRRQRTIGYIVAAVTVVAGIVQVAHGFGLI